MRPKPIDAVDMVRRIRDAMYEETKDMTSEELIAYFRQQSQGAEMGGQSLRERSDAANGNDD